MQKQVVTKKAANRNTGAAAFRAIALKEIEAPRDNTRRQFDEAKLKLLAESIRQDGVWQPILLRTLAQPKANGVRYRIVFGERRYRAAKLAGLKEIPARVQTMDDEEALGAQLVENLQREDIHPLDEADGLLRLKELKKLEIADLAQRVAKDARYVARRLALTNLIEEARDDLRKESITLAHALEICRIAPEIQAEALAACYEQKYEWDQKEGGHRSVPDKDKPARHVRYLQEWLAQNVYLNLHQSPFKLDDARLRADGLTCVDCPQRTGRDKTLFEDIREGDTCLNPPCFQAKLQTFVQLRKADLDVKQSKPAAYISPHYKSGAEAGGVLGRDQYQILTKKADRCEHAEQAVYGDGVEIGQVKWICREKDCQEHLGRSAESRSYTGSYSGSGDSSAAAPEVRNKRKQELFDIKVDEIVRKRVMKEALSTYAWPLERRHLDEVVKEFFRRIPASDQKTVCEVFGWDKEETGSLRFDDTAVLGKLATLNDDDLARFLMLCSFAHYGANQYGNNRVDQTAVVQLSAERGVNHAMIDATARAEVSPKKYKAMHEAYLEIVAEGRTAERPVVYEQTPATLPSGEDVVEKQMNGEMALT
ncbi:MAG: ParB/RepB/Spo0J family partition protein [Acidobacteriota bacterium]